MTLYHLQAQVTFAAGSNGQSYSFYVNVENDAEFCPELCKIDVSRENVVLLLGKAEESLHMWPSFEAGKSAEDKKVCFPVHLHICILTHKDLRSVTSCVVCVCVRACVEWSGVGMLT